MSCRRNPNLQGASRLKRKKMIGMQQKLPLGVVLTLLSGRACNDFTGSLCEVKISSTGSTGGLPSQATKEKIKVIHPFLCNNCPFDSSNLFLAFLSLSFTHHTTTTTQPGTQKRTLNAPSCLKTSSITCLWFRTSSSDFSSSLHSSKCWVSTWKA